MIKNGLEEEIIDGYTVSSKMKKVWNVELDLLKQFISVCERYNIRYFLADGSLLGAVRHKGFIPWDDDIDIAVPREDYNKLLSISAEAFSYPYFFQSAYSDEFYIRWHSQLRRSDTTAILKSENGVAKFNQGIFLDIFPLDGCAPNSKAEKKQDKSIRRFNKIFELLLPAWFFANPIVKSGQKLIAEISSLFLNFERKKKLFKKADALISKYSTGQETMLSYLFWPKTVDIPREIYFGTNDNTEFLEFEGIKVQVPYDYHTYLRIKFGDDYMTPRQVANVHGNIIFDTEKSYLEYINK